MEQDDFKKDIEELFRLFHKMMEQYPEEDLPGMDKMQLQQLKLFLRNYESMKDQISLEMMGAVNEPMRQMLRMFIKQLREQLGEEDFIQADDVPIIREDNAAVTVELIDEMLRRPGLKADEIDRLLDERAMLSQNNSQNLQSPKTEK
ncbi:MAG: hypothetical protein PF694_00235 [Bacteroidetes bacterium]|jgi:hypothetical protein|nr:hypothetical protein [Bacteroidota bacterium]